MICFRRSSHPFRRTDLWLSPTSSNRTEEQSLRTHFRESAFVDVPLFQFQAWSLAHWTLVKLFGRDLQIKIASIAYHFGRWWETCVSLEPPNRLVYEARILRFSHDSFWMDLPAFPCINLDGVSDKTFHKKTICMKHSMPVVKTLNQIDQIVYI